KAIFSVPSRKVLIASTVFRFSISCLFSSSKDEQNN
ncbi:MAG: hypothetical protein ACI9BN_000599, partial [Francisella sp.]